MALVLVIHVHEQVPLVVLVGADLAGAMRQHRHAHLLELVDRAMMRRMPDLVIGGGGGIDNRTSASPTLFTWSCITNWAMVDLQMLPWQMKRMREVA